MDKILEINFKSRFGFGPNTDLRLDEPIQGTNGATVDKMNRVNETIRIFIRVAIVPIFAGAGLAILIIGETNFFSRQVNGGQLLVQGLPLPARYISSWQQIWKKSGMALILWWRSASVNVPITRCQNPGFLDQQAKFQVAETLKACAGLWIIHHRHP
ncbi:hypothetical protein E5D57_000948 [Metarhizium anisopliae]|nr:hypothetical protein E5D57_000948 [Metarhizium anisopliae]